MLIINKRAGFDNDLLERFEAGIVLKGAEAKAIRMGHADLSRSFARLVQGELFLVNASVPITNLSNYEPTRTRKLLVHKKELSTLEGKVKGQKLTLVPVKMYTKGHLIKVELALARSKRKFEKREVLRQRDIDRDVQMELRGDKKSYQSRLDRD
jgi:SsrA-binding protein